MAFKLTKTEAARKSELVQELEAQFDKLQGTVSDYEAGISALRVPVEEELAAYNELLEQARNFAEDIASRAENEFDEKSEKWQESDRGEAASSWKDEWENVELDEVEIDWPEELSVDDPGHSSNLEGLSDEMEA